MQRSFGYSLKLSLVLVLVFAACGSKQDEIKLSALDHFKRGNTYFDQSRLRSAADEYKMAIAQDPHQERFYYNLGLVYYSLVLYDLAIKEYEKAIVINPAFSEAWYNLALALEKTNDTEKAFTAYQKYQVLNKAIENHEAERPKPVVTKKPGGSSAQ